MNRVASHVMLAAFVLWQVGAMLHLVLDTHVIMEDGAVADLDRRTGEPIRESEGRSPSDNGCPILNQLTTANTMASQDVITAAIDRTADVLAEARREEFLLNQSDLFQLSPSNSPPAS
jgi:hypothetical protein